MATDKIPDVRHPGKVRLRPDRISDVRHPEEVECLSDRSSGCGTSGLGRWPDRIPDVRHPEKVGCTCKRIEIRVMQSEDMCMDINIMGRPPTNVPPRLADEYAW